MKAKKKLIALITVMLMVIMTVIPVSAGTTYTPATGGTPEFKKYLVMEENSSVPNGEFSFTIAPGTAVPATSTTMEIIAGVEGAAVRKAVFTNSDTTYSAIEQGDISVAPLNAGYKYAKSIVTVDFSSCLFPEPGIYRYVITENNYAGDFSGAISMDSNPRYMDVYVTDDGNGVLSVSGYVMHSTADAPSTNGTNGTSGAAIADKSDGFRNELGSWDLYVGKKVTGNQGSRDKYFKLTITISGLTDGQKLTIDNTSNADATPVKNAATTYNTMSNPSSVTADTNGTATVEVYLQNDQYVTVKGIPDHANYTVSEVAEDYKSVEGAGTIGSTTFNDPVSETTGATEDDVHTGFTNTRDGVIPTGILLSATPWIIVGVVVIAGLAFFAIRSRRKYDEE